MTSEALQGPPTPTSSAAHLLQLPQSLCHSQHLCVCCSPKESTFRAGDPGSIPGSGRSAGEEIGYPLQYPWAPLVVQLIKNLPAMQETWVRSLGWEEPLAEGKATHSSILDWRIPWTV